METLNKIIKQIEEALEENNKENSSWPDWRTAKEEGLLKAKSIILEELKELSAMYLFMMSQDEIEDPVKELEKDSKEDNRELLDELKRLQEVESKNRQMDHSGKNDGCFIYKKT